MYGEWSSRHRFLGENQRLLEEAEELEHRARRRDIVVDEHTLFDFYDARVGPEVVSGAHFDRWWKQERRTHPDLLTFDPAMLTHDTAEEVRADDFPEAWQGEGLTFPISYHFEPGAADDGLTIDVPVATLNRVAADDFSWNVPGVRHELVTSLIRSLPKNLRVSFVPAPDKAREFLAATPPGDEPLLDALERWARSTTGVVVPRDAWDWAKVPAHLQPTYRVVGDDRRRAGARQGPRGAEGTAARPVRRGARRGRRRQRAAAPPARPPGPSVSCPRRSCRRGPGTRCSPIPRSPTRARPSGSGSSAPREEAASRHRLGVRRLLLLELPTGDPTAGLDTAAAARPGRLAVPDRGRAARRPPRRHPGRRRRRPRSRPHARGVRRAGGGRRRRARPRAPSRCSPTCSGSCPTGATPTACSAAVRSWRPCPRCRTCASSSPGW